MDLSTDGVIFEANVESAVSRRFLWWIVPFVIFGMATALLLPISPTIAWIVLGFIPPVALFVMPRMLPLEVELLPDRIRFGSGMSTRSIVYDAILVVDLRRSDGSESDEAEDDDDDDEKADEAADESGTVAGNGVGTGIGNGVGDATAQRDDGEQKSDFRSEGPSAESTGSATKSKDVPPSAETWRVTIHVNLIPVSISLAAADARTLATSLHQMCPRAALWDVDGRLVEPIDRALADESIARVKRLVVVRRVLSMVGGVLSFGAFTGSFGAAGGGGIISQLMPFLWIGIGAGLVGAAAGAEKRLLTKSREHEAESAAVASKHDG